MITAYNGERIERSFHKPQKHRINGKSGKLKEIFLNFLRINFLFSVDSYSSVLLRLSFYSI